MPRIIVNLASLANYYFRVKPEGHRHLLPAPVLLALEAPQIGRRHRQAARDERYETRNEKPGRWNPGSAVESLPIGAS